MRKYLRHKIRVRSLAVELKKSKCNSLVELILQIELHDNVIR